MASSRIAAIARRSYMDPDDEEEVSDHHGEDIHGKLNTLTFQQVKVPNTSALRPASIGSPPPPQPPPKLKEDASGDSNFLQRNDPLPTAATTEKVVFVLTFGDQNRTRIRKMIDFDLIKNHFTCFVRALKTHKARMYPC